MFSKTMFKVRIGASGWIAGLCCFAAVVRGFPSMPPVQNEIVDRIAAVVNDEVITLSDLQIVKAFRLFPGESGDGEDDRIVHVLDEMIDHKVVLQMTGEASPVEEGALDTHIDGIISKIGAARFREELERFGMTRKDLFPYVREMLAYRKIIDDRFKKAAVVSLNEIERHYKQVYLPQQREKGLEPEPMLDVLSEIEESIKQQKSKAQVKEWIDNLKERAEIQRFL